MPRPYRFFLLDDDSDIRFLHRHALRRAFPGCVVVEAESYEDARGQLAGAGPFDAVISDHQLQGPTGAECIVLMRGRGVTCPILLVTSSDDPRVHQQAYAAGATRVFPPGDANFISFLRGTLTQDGETPLMALDSPPLDFFQQLADGAPVMIWMAGLDMGCFYFNRAWLDFRGRTLEQEAGNGWAEGVHPEDLQRCVNHYIACFERRLSFAMSYRLQNRRGAYCWILDRGAPHYLPDGKFLGFFGGCAEIETDTPISRHNELGSSLARMKEFAGRVAAEEAVAARAAGDQAMQLQRFAREAQDDYAERTLRRKHAVGEMEQLASDMLAFGNIGHGECVP